MSAAEETAARLVKVERAIGMIAIFAERQYQRQDEANLLALNIGLLSLDILSAPELAAIRHYFAISVVG